MKKLNALPKKKVVSRHSPVPVKSAFIFFPTETDTDTKSTSLSTTHF